MANNYDTIIIGAGLNGLTTAAYLSKAGKRVLVLEARASIGGAASTEEVFPGFQFDTITHNVVGFDPAIARDLGLAQHGLQLIASEINAFLPGQGSAGIGLWRDDAKTADSIKPFSTKDASQWKLFRERMAKLARVTDSIHAMMPPDIGTTKPGELWSLGRLGLQVRGLGKREMPAFIRTVPMPIAELLDDEFEGELLKGGLAAVGVRGMMLGPRGSGTGYNFLRGVQDGAVGATVHVRGGVGKLAEALAGAAKARGAEIRTNAQVAQIRVVNQRATGVVLASGEEIGAAKVVSSADPRRTFLQMIEPTELEPTFRGRVRNIRMRGCVAKMNFALGGLPNFKNAAAELLRGTIAIAPSINDLERAYDDAKYGGISHKPYLEIVIPTLSDAMRAPEGKHVMSVWMQYAPYNLKEGNWSEQRDKLGKLITDTVSEYAPNFKSLILHEQILTPCDLEERYGLTEGDVNHGQTTLDQFLFMRPVPGYADYRTPIEGLYFCGAGAHPGGLPAAAGRNAARVV